MPKKKKEDHMGNYYTIRLGVGGNFNKKTVLMTRHLFVVLLDVIGV